MSNYPQRKAIQETYYVEFSLAGVWCTSQGSNLLLTVAEALAKELLAAGAANIQIKRSGS